LIAEKAILAIHDPPYNVDINDEFGNLPLDEYITWCEKWVDNTIDILNRDASFYIWLGADIRNDLQPLPDFIIMMRKKPIKIRNFITMRNQRGYGTQKNWMAVRQELLYYIKGSPLFNVQAEYTDIPKKTRGYYKKVNGKLTENFERSKSLTIRAGNVWYDIQQVFYLMHENVEGCFAQKPLKAAKRIIDASSKEEDIIVDFFGHSGSSLVQAEISKRRCYTMDINPTYCKIMVARLLHYRRTGKPGWGKTKVLQNGKILVGED
jgi:site-specific DNA-methyltransferase (adenine-specific)